MYKYIISIFTFSTIIRSVTRTFQEIGGKPEYEFIVKISYLEIYNETVYILYLLNSICLLFYLLLRKSYNSFI